MLLLLDFLCQSFTVFPPAGPQPLLHLPALQRGPLECRWVLLLCCGHCHHVSHIHSYLSVHHQKGKPHNTRGCMNKHDTKKWFVCPCVFKLLNPIFKRNRILQAYFKKLQYTFGCTFQGNFFFFKFRQAPRAKVMVSLCICFFLDGLFISLSSHMNKYFRSRPLTQQ